MEKLIYAFWRGSQHSPQQLRETLQSNVRAGLARLGVERLQFNVADLQEHEEGIPPMGRTRPLPDGFVSFWLTSAYHRPPAEQVLCDLLERVAGYVVSESTILRNVAHPSAEGERSWGFSQVAFLHTPSRMSFEEWRRVWFEQHTPVAITTQANFRYVQNVVVQPLTPGAPPWRGIVEESFPLEAVRDASVFFDAVGDEAKFHRHYATMMESVGRFLEPDGVDLIRTSEYLLHSQPEPAL